MYMKLFLLFAFVTFSAFSGEVKLLIGTHDDSGSEGAYMSSFNFNKGSLGKAELFTPRPGVVIVRAGGKGVYYTAGGKKDAGYIKSFKDGKLTGEVKGFPKGPCYISIDKSRRYVFTSNIGGGSVSSFSLKEDGSLNKLVQSLEVKASSKAFKAHSINISPDNKFLYVADIAGKRICRIQFNEADGTMKYDGDVTSKNFVGPRHFIFGPQGKFGYLMNQMGGAVTVFEYNGNNGALKEIQHISALPKDFNGKNHSAEILIHPSGKFLYCSNRGPNTVTLFKRDADKGTLEYVETVPSGGDSPWSFAVSPKGAYLACSNRKSNNVVVFKVNPKDGKLTQTEVKISVPAPSSLSFLAE